MTRAELGLDPRKKVLVLATSSFTYDSDQTYLVDMLLDAVRAGELRHPLHLGNAVGDAYLARCGGSCPRPS